MPARPPESGKPPSGLANSGGKLFPAMHVAEDALIVDLESFVPLAKGKKLDYKGKRKEQNYDQSHLFGSSRLGYRVLLSR